MKRHLTCSTVAAVVLALPFSVVPVTAQVTGMEPLEPEIIDYGAEPRQLLRYAWVEGHAEKVEMTATISTSVSLDGEPMMDMDIPMTVAMDAIVTDVNEDGSARMEYVFTRFDVSDVSVSGDVFDLEEDVSDVMSDVTDEMQGMTGDFIGVTGWQVIDDRGRIVELGVDMPETFPAELRDQFDQMSSTATAAEPLPEEPVGLGARWVSSGLFDSAGVGFDMETVTEVVALDPAGVTLQRNISMDLGDATDIFGEMPPGTEVRVEEFTFTGGGDTRVAFDGISAEGGIGFDFGFEITASGQEDGVPVSLDMRMDMAMLMEMDVE